MNIAGLIFLGAGYLLGNERARTSFAAALQQFAGRGIDALNELGKGGDANVVQPASADKPD